MQQKFNTIGLVIRQDMQSHLDTVGLVTTALGKHANLLVHSLDADFSMAPIQTVGMTKLVEQCDLVISLGGDGTLLTAARALVDKKIPLLGINLGRLGFLADVSVSDFEQHLGAVIAGKYTVESRFFIEGEIEGPNRASSKNIAINDIILHSHEGLSMIEYEVYSDGILIHRQRADGVIVTTPTGSTAYALSGGGPIMHPSLETLAIVPICPHTLSNRPIVLPANQVIEIRLSEVGSFAQINYDGQSTAVIDAQDRVRIKRYPQPINLLHPENYDYFQILRAKLYWSTNY
ncbi:MAG: NAD(+) kinase [Gammaproteobacteria bacterium]|nr:NAD(+) kinase [Gammaproteobacteria bacterium]